MTRFHKYLILLILILILILSSLFIVDQRKQALVLQFGQVVKDVREPGLKFKIPFVQNIIFFEKRAIDLGLIEQEVIASDQKRLIINAFTQYRIVDPLKFYITVGNKVNAESKLSSILDSSLRKIIGQFPLNKLLSEDRALIMSKIKEIVKDETKIFGIQIIDVRIMRGDLPKENSNSIFTRMQTEREKEAKEIRAKGAEESSKIRAEANKDRSILIANAKKQSEIIRGEGDGRATEIFYKVFSKDPDFFEFYRSMRAYKKSMKGSNTSVIVSPKGEEFFKFIGGNRLH